IAPSSTIFESLKFSGLPSFLTYGSLVHLPAWLTTISIPLSIPFLTVSLFLVRYKTPATNPTALTNFIFLPMVVTLLLVINHLIHYPLISSHCLMYHCSYQNILINRRFYK